jgi:RNA polymerase sigma-70 factor (ECF subfamily)
MTDLAERQAIAALKRGDPNGLEVLVRRYQVRAIRAAYLIVRDRAAAEDIVQAAFVRAYDRIAQFDAARPFGPWFLRGVVNDSLKAATRRARHVSLETPLGADGDLDAAAETLAERLADPGPGPEDLAEAADRQQAVWRALGRLSAAERGAIVLRYYLGRGEHEMAAELGAPPGTVKWRLHAARQRLRAWLAPALGVSAETPGDRAGGE